MINSATREDPPMRPYPLILAGLLTGCASLSHDTRLDDALSEQFGSELPGYQSALYDLDDDGVDDALIYAQGPDWCGSAGCTLFVLQGSEHAFTLRSRTTIAQLPLWVSAHSTDGWRDLIVHARGAGDVVLRATDSGYPLNPSMQRPATAAELQSSEILLEYPENP
ncbi:MAG: hypothetical protein VYD45_16650 [Pseudomonadota bacterium]|nr:hypothetical protein [Pseudomonadota bacterium]